MAVEKYIEYLSDDEELYDAMDTFYDLISAAKQSVYHSFVKTDMSKRELKELIKKEAIAVDKIGGAYSIGLRKDNMISSLKPMYLTLKNSLKENNDKPVFYHVNKLKENVHKQKQVTFVEPSFVFHDGCFILGNALILSIPFLYMTVKDVEDSLSCKVYKISFHEVGTAVIEDKEYHNLTKVILYLGNKHDKSNY